ncbi:SMP-30/gluconolactonase/LRE family protein [Flavihumibacter fluvii]|uniref:SMP-30/gluconolactonase/LRE family protein n=1 Tax=Flavihumibacter fluvii TaxID=2838157 RepID=UPI001BDF13D4|nr:SMP-30/gluconolactonase/LRE family protein [Flavihumibacter fluvii]ULQ51394.1 SMP-30/gluconolactonase/LRE family protein [Flavihumibacter fluvii]
MIASLLVRMPCELGEGPVWYKSRNSLFWVDIIGQSIHEYIPGKNHVNTWPIGHMVSLVFEKDRDNMLLGIQGGLVSFNLVTHELNWLAEIEKDNPRNRTNDGGIDARGNIWIGTMELNCQQNAGALYVVDKNFVVTRKLNQLSIPNGLVFSPDQQHMYHIDSETKKVESYSYDIDHLDIRHEKTLVEIPAGKGSPDGMTMDEEGMLWIAQWGGFCVSRWDPGTGKQIGAIEVPVPHVSACIFGGDNLDQLYITTARQNLTEESRQKYPDSGSVFVAHPGVKGFKK